MISVIVPIKDQPSYLKECLASMISNKCLFEVLVIDDHSNSRNAKKTEECCNAMTHYMDIRYIESSLPNIPRSCLSPIKEGLRKAYGTYVKIIGADDYLEPYSLDYENDLIDDCDGLITGYVKTDEVLKPLIPATQHIWIPYKDLSIDMMKLGCHIPDYMLTKAKFFSDVIFKEDIGSRWLWYVWMQMMYNGIKIKSDERITLRYRQHSDNISKDDDFTKYNVKMPKLFAELEELHAVLSDSRNYRPSRRGDSKDTPKPRG